MQRLLIILGCFLSLDAVCKIIALGTGPNSFLAVHNGVTLLVCFALAIPMAIYMIRVNEKNGKREREDLKPLADKMSLGCWGALVGFALTIIISYYTSNVIWVAVLGSLIIGGEIVFNKTNMKKYNDASVKMGNSNESQAIPSQNTLVTDSKLVLLSKDKYEALLEAVYKSYMLLDTICSEKEFIDYMSGINKGPSSVVEKSDLLFGMKCFFRTSCR